MLYVISIMICYNKILSFEREHFKVWSIPGFSHSLGSRGPCLQAGNFRLSCWWIFCTWFTTEDHFAWIIPSSSPQEEAADQYRWFVTLLIHDDTVPQSRSLASARSFFLTAVTLFPNVLILTLFQYIINSYTINWSWSLLWNNVNSFNFLKNCFSNKQTFNSVY